MTELVRFSALALALSLLWATWLPSAVASSDCDAEVDSELTREEPGETGTHLTWRVDIRTEEECATVEFQLILTLQKPDGKEETVVRLGSVRLSDGSISHQMRYEVRPEDRLTKWKVVQSKCEPCVANDLE